MYEGPEVRCTGGPRTSNMKHRILKGGGGGWL